MGKKIFTPDLTFDSICDISVQMLQVCGITWLALDLDNTITHDCRDDIPKNIAEKLDELKADGILIAVISNNDSARVERFATKSGLFCISNAQKPSKSGLVRAANALKKPLCEGAVVGDQIFTDVWAGKNAGMTVFLVKPLGKDLGQFVRFKRQLERLTKTGRNRYTKCK